MEVVNETTSDASIETSTGDGLEGTGAVSESTQQGVEKTTQEGEGGLGDADCRIG